jgi:hypothetical protein
MSPPRDAARAYPQQSFASARTLRMALARFWRLAALTGPERGRGRLRRRCWTAQPRQAQGAAPGHARSSQDGANPRRMSSARRHTEQTSPCGRGAHPIRLVVERDGPAEAAEGGRLLHPHGADLAHARNCQAGGS